jgi:hypothetical protein
VKNGRNRYPMGGPTTKPTVLTPTHQLPKQTHLACLRREFDRWVDFLVILSNESLLWVHYGDKSNALDAGLDPIEASWCGRNS